MNPKYQRLSQCNSQQNFSIPYFCPLSPFQKIVTPHRVRVTSTPSGQTSPITFLTAVNQDKSPSGKQNEGVILNQSPITNRFSTKQRDMFNEIKKSPIVNMNKKIGSKISNHSYHKSDMFQSTLHKADSNNISCRNFEQGLYSLKENSPQGIQKNQQNLPKMKLSNNFKSILQAQKYQIKQKDTRILNPQGLLKKYSISIQQEKLFSSCFQNLQKQAINQKNLNKNNSTLLCMNDDGNIAKYITIATQEDDQRLYYCSKCTLLLVNQGFVLQEIQSQSSSIKETRVSDNFADIYKIEACKDKLGSLINDLSMRQQSQVAKVSQFYDNLLSLLENCKVKKKEQIKALYQQKISQYEEILAEVQASTKNLEKNQQKYSQFEGLYEEILKFSLGEPYLKPYGNEQLNKIKQSFSQSLQNEFCLNFSIIINEEQSQAINNRNHGLRFSFQKLLNDISSKKNKMQNIINSLQQQQEEDSQCIQMEGEMNQKAAFRDLFPEAEDSCQINSGVNSPTFKNF